MQGRAVTVKSVLKSSGAGHQREHGNGMLLASGQR